MEQTEQIRRSREYTGYIGFESLTGTSSTQVSKLISDLFVYFKPVTFLYFTYILITHILRFIRYVFDFLFNILIYQIINKQIITIHIIIL